MSGSQLLVLSACSFLLTAKACYERAIESYFWEKLNMWIKKFHTSVSSLADGGVYQG